MTMISWYRVLLLDVTYTEVTEYKRGLSTDCAIVKCQIEEYRKEPDLKIKQNPLEWWRLKQQRYPVLCSLAKKYLAIEATSAAAERVFSQTNRITTNDRNRLTPGSVEKIMYVKCNLKWWQDYCRDNKYDELINFSFEVFENNNNDDTEDDKGKKNE